MAPVASGQATRGWHLQGSWEAGATCLDMCSEPLGLFLPEEQAAESLLMLR